MASDEDYASFLDKANQSTKPATTASSRKGPSNKAVHDGMSVPKSLKDGLDGVYYISDADEEFEEVALKWDGAQELDEESFKHLIGTKGTVKQISDKDFDPRSQYDQVLENVRKNTKKGEVKVFRVETGEGARVEYWVVGESKDRMAVFGLRARAVES